MSTELDIKALSAKVEDAKDYGVLEVSTNDLSELIGQHEWLTTKLQTTRAQAATAEAQVARVREALDGMTAQDAEHIRTALEVTP